MHQHHDEHAHRNLDVIEEPLDAANQALSDALRVSFVILKIILVVLAVSYCFSNILCIESHEQAIRLRLGRLLPGVHDAGMVKAWPFPLEQILVLPTKKASTSTIDSHNFHRRDHEKGKDLDFISRGLTRGLNPVLDGALMTSDQGLVHVQWRVTYRFQDVSDYISNIKGDQVEAAEELIKTIVETAGIHVASTMTAEEVIRTKVADTQEAMKVQINRRLRSISSGLFVDSIEMSLFTPPIQVRAAFNATQAAENRKQATIQRARRDKEQLLNNAAGMAHRRFEELFRRLDRSEDDAEMLASIQGEIDDVLTNETEGRTGEMIKQAGAYHARIVGEMQGDVELYRTLLPQYRRNSRLLIARLWEESRQRILSNRHIVKMYRPWGVGQLRLQLARDPEQSRIDEAIQMQKEKSDVTKELNDDYQVPVGLFEG